jgi:hypothetical protein
MVFSINQGTGGEKSLVKSCGPVTWITCRYPTEEADTPRNAVSDPDKKMI